MWLKVLLQLRELLPHLTRLAPLAQRMMEARSNDTAMFQEFSENMEQHLGQLAGANGALHRQLQQQNDRLEELQAELARTAPALNEAMTRISSLEDRLDSLLEWVRAAAILAGVASFGAIIILFLLATRH